MIVALPDANQTLPRDHLQRRRVAAPRATSSRASSSRASRTACSTSATSSRAAAGATSSSPTRRSPTQTTVYLRQDAGGWCIDRDEADGGARARERHAPHHVARTARTSTTAARSSDADLNVDAETRLPAHADRQGRQRDDDRRAARRRSPRTPTRGAPSYSQLYTIQQKFSLPAACLVLALIGLALGVSNRKDGKLASFVARHRRRLRLLHHAVLAARGGARRPAAARASRRGSPNIVLGAAGIVLVIWRAGSADQPIRFSIPRFWRRPGDRGRRQPRRRRPPAAPAARRRRRQDSAPRSAAAAPARSLHHRASTCRSSCWPFVALLGHLLHLDVHRSGRQAVPRHRARRGMLLRYFYFETPQYVYYIIPMAALVATLVTIGLLTKNSELIVMRACGISLYRSAVPLLLFALALQRRAVRAAGAACSPDSNREADAAERDHPRLPDADLRRPEPQVDRRPRAATSITTSTSIRGSNQFNRLSMYRPRPRDLAAGPLTYAKDAALGRAAGADDEPALDVAGRATAGRASSRPAGGAAP